MELADSLKLIGDLSPAMKGIYTASQHQPACSIARTASDLIVAAIRYSGVELESADEIIDAISSMTDARLEELIIQEGFYLRHIQENQLPHSGNTEEVSTHVEKDRLNDVIKFQEFCDHYNLTIGQAIVQIHHINGIEGTYPWELDSEYVE